MYINPGKFLPPTINVPNGAPFPATMGDCSAKWGRLKPTHMGRNPTPRQRWPQVWLLMPWRHTINSAPQYLSKPFSPGANLGTVIVTDHRYVVFHASLNSQGNKHLICLTYRRTKQNGRDFADDFSFSFSWMKICAWSLVPLFQKGQHWFIEWHWRVTSHYLNKWWPSSLTHIRVTHICVKNSKVKSNALNYQVSGSVCIFSF